MKDRLDSELHEALAIFPHTDLNDVAGTRQIYKQVTDAMLFDLDCSGVEISDRAVSQDESGLSVPVRCYMPEERTGEIPALLFIHGGGFVVGDLDSEHAACVYLCQSLGIGVFSVDYRLAPENPYPAALDDCYCVLEWMAAEYQALGLDRSRIGLFGKSAGGCLALATAITARDRNGPAIRFQYIGMPVTDDRLDTPSMKEFTETLGWNQPSAITSWKMYLGEQYSPGNASVPASAAPARSGNLGNLPPTYVSTMALDPLRDEGILLAMRMMQAGVDVELHCFPGTFHGSSIIRNASVSLRERDEMVSVLRKALSK